MASNPLSPVVIVLDESQTKSESSSLIQPSTPGQSSTISHGDLDKDQYSYSLTNHSGGHKEYLCVPNGLQTCDQSHSSMCSASLSCSCDLCACDFYCESCNCSTENLSDEVNHRSTADSTNQMESVSEQNLSCIATTTTTTTTTATTTTEEEINNKTDIDIRIQESSPSKHYRSQQQNQHCGKNGHDGGSLLRQSFFYKSLQRTKSVPLKTKSKEDVRQEGQPNYHNYHDHQHSDTNSPSCSRHSSNHFNIFSPKVWKRSLLKLNDDRSGSRFSLRRTFSLRSSTSGHGGDGGQISFPSRKKKRQKYKIVEAKTGQADGVSFELVNKQGCFLRVKGAMLMPDREAGSDASFNKDATFVPLKDMWFPSFFAFESVSKPSYFIRLLSEGELVIDKYDGTKDFKEEASFQLNKNPDATSLMKDVNAWVKTNTGEYCLGKISFVDDVMVKVELNDGKMERCLRSESFKLVPDIVPCRNELTVGIRVLSQGLHRRTYYPGVVSAVRRGDSFDILFDDGDVGRGKSYNMRLMKNFPNIRAASNKENHSPYTHAHLKATRSNPVYKVSNFETCSTTLYSPALSDTHLAITSPDANFIKRLNVPVSRYTFSPWEIESDSQDSGYHEYSKNNNNYGGTSSDELNCQRRRKHGWIPSGLTENYLTISPDGTESIPLDEHVFNHSTSTSPATLPLTIIIK